MMTDRRPAAIRLLPAMLTGVLMLAIVIGCRSSGPTRWEPERKIPFSPDDHAIAYTHNDAIYVARTQGDKHRKVFEAGPGQLISTPHWAPGQRGFLFAVSVGKPDESSGNIGYEVQFWTAPEDIWTGDDSSAAGDTVELPERWTPGLAERLFEANAMNAVQIFADALVDWHPDGRRVLYLDASAGRQSVYSFDRSTGDSAAVSPVSSPSLAYAVSPDGEYLQVAAGDGAATELWVGPLDASMAAWHRIDDRAGPGTVPKEELPTTGADGESAWLYDLRPQLGTWSPDSRWLAHKRRIEANPESGNGRESVAIVLTPIDAPERQQSIPFASDSLGRMHWEPGGARLGVLHGGDLLIIEIATGVRTDLAGALEVEQFIGWSKPGDKLAYLLGAEHFDVTWTLLPTGHVVRWAPTVRHNLVIAEHDGTLPRSRFNMMNIEAAQWSNQSAKLSFWATYLPTVSLLPPGDPAAVLDLDKDSIRWYPTDLAEYAHVGHYYLLNGEANQAIEQYSDALRRVDDAPEETRLPLKRNLHLWRGVAYLASDRRVQADRDFTAVREYSVIEPDEFEGEWDVGLMRALVADRDTLSTMISMSYVPVATDYAREIAAASTDARRIQALCYLSLIHSSLGQHEAFSKNLVDALLPELLASAATPAQNVGGMLDSYLEQLTEHDNISQLGDSEKLMHGASLAALAQSYPDRRNSLLRAAMAFYRSAGDTAAETGILRWINAE
jgi:hypothetical protein